MAYRNRRRTGYARRYRSYRRRVLKKSQIFSKKSAKSQAKQIYYLNKKINYLVKKTTPEVDTITGNLKFESNLQNSRPLKEFNKRIPVFKDYLIYETAQDHYQDYNYTLSLNEDTNLINVRSIKFYGNFGFSEDNSYTMPYADLLPNGTITAKAPKSAYLKLIFCRTKSGGGSFPQRLTTHTVNNNPNTTAFTDLNLIQGPLIKDLGKRMTILKVKTIKITDTYPEKMWKVSFKNLNYKKVPGNEFNAGEIFIYVQYVCPTMLQHADTSTGAITKFSPAIHYTINYKLVYNKSPGIVMMTPATHLPDPNPNKPPGEA